MSRRAFHLLDTCALLYEVRVEFQRKMGDEKTSEMNLRLLNILGSIILLILCIVNVLSQNRIEKLENEAVLAKEKNKVMVAQLERVEKELVLIALKSNSGKIYRGRRNVFGENVQDFAISRGIPETSDDVSSRDKHIPMEDCRAIFDSGEKKSGIYRIQLKSGKVIQVYCDMESDGGGWTVFQRRNDSSTDFYRGWKEYQQGFGNLKGNFWLGLDAIHELTSWKEVALRIDMKRMGGEKGYATYSHFKIGPEMDKYKLDVSGFSGNIRDSFLYHNKMKFSTKDNDNDIWNAPCAIERRGAWWYRQCVSSNLNAMFPKKGINYFGRIKSMSWVRWKYSSGDIIFSEMKIR